MLTKIRFYMQLILWAGMVMMVSPLAAHEYHDVDYYANSALYITWHDMSHAIGAFVSQMSPVYATALLILLAVLAYIAIKVKLAGHLSSS